jgi:hypothetical protein
MTSRRIAAAPGMGLRSLIAAVVTRESEAVNGGVLVCWVERLKAERRACLERFPALDDYIRAGV